MRILVQILIFSVILGVSALYWINSKPIQGIDWELANKKDESKEWEGRQAPDFSLLEHENNQNSPQRAKLIQLSNYSGQPVLVHFWATWCLPCVEEFPSLNRFASWAQQKLGLVVLAISKDEDPSKISTFLMRNKVWTNKNLPVKILLDANSTASEKYKCNMYPETFLIGKNSIIMKKFTGAQNWDSEEMKKWFLENIR